jgi:hypothetical protein
MRSRVWGVGERSAGKCGGRQRAWVFAFVPEVPDSSRGFLMDGRRGRGAERGRARRGLREYKRTGRRRSALLAHKQAT